MKRSIAFAGLLVILAGFYAATPAWAQGCVDVEVSVSPEQACPGTRVLMTLTVTNCGELMDRVTLTISGLGYEKTLPPFRLAAGGTRRAITVAMVPTYASPGIYTVTVDAASSNGGSDSEDVILDVISCP